MTTPRRTLCLIICGAGPAPHATTLIDLAHRDGWRVTVVATPTAGTMIDNRRLAEATGQPVRAEYHTPGATGPRPSSADALLIAPATYNTINKLAAGIADTYALTTAAEAIGRGTPTTILPFVNTALAARKPFQHAVHALRAEGVTVLYGPGLWEPHLPGTGDQHLATYPWHRALATLIPARHDTSSERPT
ncbi:flavoprotein [Mangrovihabitans endophyticus]|uniref:Flavoprotein n=1 Tax=Mangrovihabitans endophyticus TaxID=1751298 RepID=A0A8J3C4W2_9ACTN|nr:flavoprotein [Mangrovihabitans endophyticus]GGL18973.1 flavoprotein [Mangrovihabitans endophyticus]